MRKITYISADLVNKNLDPNTIIMFDSENMVSIAEMKSIPINKFLEKISLNHVVPLSKGMLSISAGFFIDLIKTNPGVIGSNMFSAKARKKMSFVGTPEFIIPEVKAPESESIPVDEEKIIVAIPKIPRIHIPDQEEESPELPSKKFFFEEKTPYNKEFRSSFRPKKKKK